MITTAEVRALALSFPEAIEAPHFDRASFRVRGKIFATLAPDGRSGMLKLDLDAHEALLAAYPKAFFSFGGWSKSGATGVNFARVKKAMLRELMEVAAGLDDHLSSAGAPGTVIDGDRARRGRGLAGVCGAGGCRWRAIPRRRVST